MPLMPSPERRVLVAADMQRYSRQSNLDQFHSQANYREVMQEAAQAVGLTRGAWNIQKTGDGEVSVLPANTPESTVIYGLVTELDRRLRDLNRPLADHAKVRLRLAVHNGLVHHDAANGFAGEAVVATARLVNAQTLKDALDHFRDAALGLIVSDAIYNDVVRHRYEGIRPERFCEVQVDEKEFSGRAWIFIPDEDVTRMRPRRPKPPATCPDASATRTRSGPGEDRTRRRRGVEPGPARGDSYTVQDNQFQGPVAFGPGASAVTHSDRSTDTGRGV